MMYRRCHCPAMYLSVPVIALLSPSSSFALRLLLPAPLAAASVSCSIPSTSWRIVLSGAQCRRSQAFSRSRFCSRIGSNTDVRTRTGVFVALLLTLYSYIKSATAMARIISGTRARYHNVIRQQPLRAKSGSPGNPYYGE